MKPITYSLFVASMMIGMQSGMAQDSESLLSGDALPAEQAAVDQLNDPDVKVRQAGNKTVKEFHEQGRTYKIEVIPENTPAYILSDQDGSGELDSSNTSIDTGVVVPEWKIGSW